MFCKRTEFIRLMVEHTKFCYQFNNDILNSEKKIYNKMGCVNLTVIIKKLTVLKKKESSIAASFERCVVVVVVVIVVVMVTYLDWLRKQRVGLLLVHSSPITSLQ